ncbi:CHAP domain-containing protein [Streptomyces sp. NBC_01500]|uniref:CHAP domain-containing protein n=1 Tax=Streptomyces sp. NBC_01500 TaxID=2903886 RepID=UPI00225727BA|nr:CHAP domain-containing protein [Streptomyces sp. NBC_01500]MCX4547274.1 CHAP domain-containing protein [Streptomyces sp. NBC_01500]MCX4554194.1 CHAP domain-containing protein [Streptomyces sp. NBC_01500]MCX4554534.1 CHAP domain-containing protein [Streptomyces sp. NBC_01500]
MTATAADVLKVAKAEVGTQETRSGGHWVNDSKYNKWYGNIPGYGRGGYDYPYCAVFVAWCADKAGAAGLYPKTAGCTTAVAWFKNAGRFSEYPAVGAQVFFGPGGGTHTGLVVSYTDTVIITVEGNTNINGNAEGDGVYQRTRKRKDSYVYGYGYPKFNGGIKSADPAYAKEAPKPAAKPTVDLTDLIRAAKTDPKAAQGHQTYAAGVRLVEAALKGESFLAAKYASDGSFGTTTIEAYRKWQKALGYKGPDADGIPGLSSLTRLGAKHGFGVKP